LSSMSAVTLCSRSRSLRGEMRAAMLAHIGRGQPKCRTPGSCFAFADVHAPPPLSHAAAPRSSRARSRSVSPSSPGVTTPREPGVRAHPRGSSHARATCPRRP
jgi:hypothetical protein